MSLYEIDGIGEKKARALLRRFKTLTAIRNASVDHTVYSRGDLPQNSGKNICFLSRKGRRNRMKKAVVFDLDGTQLLNTLDDLCDSTNYALTAVGFPTRTIEEVRRFVGNGIRKLIERAVPDTATAEQTEACYQIFCEHYKHNMENKTAEYGRYFPICSPPCATRATDLPSSPIKRILPPRRFAVRCSGNT